MGYEMYGFIGKKVALTPIAALAAQASNSGTSPNDAKSSEENTISNKNNNPHSSISYLYCLKH